jgi:hypothetical protein
MRSTLYVWYRSGRRRAGKCLSRVAPGVMRWVRPSTRDTASYSALELDELIAHKGSANTTMRLPGNPLAAQAIREGRIEKVRFANHTGYEAPGPGVVFAAVCNDKYAPGLEALVLSLQQVYPGMTNRFVVYHDDSLSAFSRARLLDLYAHFEFVVGDPDAYTVTMGDAYNHQRVGHLGYLTLAAIGIEDADHVVILDSDLLVLGDISPLWGSDLPKAVPDIGQRPYAVVCRATGRVVINSGVLSLPRNERGPDAVARAQALLTRIDRETDPDLAGFADQKFWNLFFAGRELELLPQNFNTVKTLLETTHPDEIGTVQVLHVTGPKPWYAFVSGQLITPDDKARSRSAPKTFARTFALWNQSYLANLQRARLGDFRENELPRIRALAAATPDRPTVLIGNGPSLADTDMTAFEGYTKVVFNWFVNHDDFDDIKPDHLVLASHMLFGGWHTPTPKLPDEYLSALTSHVHRPRLWIAEYFRHYVETLDELAGYEISYFFFEKPFKRPIAHAGVVSLDLGSPLVDSHTGVLTVGVPLALALGSKDAVLVGCDSNYGSARGSYFYNSEDHASPTTNEASLLSTWSEGGEAFYAYRVVAAEAARQGLMISDATIDGRLDMLPRLTLDAARALAPRSAGGAGSQ